MYYMYRIVTFAMLDCIHVAGRALRMFRMVKLLSLLRLLRLSRLVRYIGQLEQVSSESSHKSRSPLVIPIHKVSTSPHTVVRRLRTCVYHKHLHIIYPVRSGLSLT